MTESSDQSEACLAAAQQAEEDEGARGFLFLAQSYARRGVARPVEAVKPSARPLGTMTARATRGAPLLDRNDA